MNRFDKYPHPLNFKFADGFTEGVAMIAGHSLSLRAIDAGNDIYHISVTNHQPRPFGPPADALRRSGGGKNMGSAHTRLDITASAGLILSTIDGRTLLATEAGGWLGFSGTRWMFRFINRPAMQFYGLGEKHTPFEKSGRAYWFWNTDVWADHPWEHVRDGDYDPDYLSIPYLIIKQNSSYIGLLVDAHFPAYISVGAQPKVAGAFDRFRKPSAELFLGAVDGPPSLYLFYGPSLAELTRKFQILVGPTPLPPVWSLGYHQSRWGYKSAEDLGALADRFERHHFPADGLWLDIDYMEGFRVFTIDSRHFPQPAETISELRQRGFRIVPILDPGIKREEGYAVYDSGRAAGVFCLNPAGGLFTGLVWPGFTVFPDFSRPETRRWWAGHARSFFELGFEGAWLDMNDPSTGSVDCRDMLFDRGRQPHEAYHNSYALLMARATRNGLLEARPERRPFLLSRSGSTGSQKYCAHWTGDNFSSYRHLRRSITKSLNLALSGIPFNGADVGGFGGDCTEALLVDWFKAAFLMPFLRNHTMRGSRPQEPWAYSRRALGVIRRFVRLRYTLLPYLYNLFIDQEEKGEAILRPLIYDFDDSPSLPLGYIDDQFMVGPALMQAPFVWDKRRQRDVVLPGHKWLRSDTGEWIAGGRHLRVRRRFDATPLFLREGSLIPFQPGVRTTNRKDLNTIGLLCCLSPGYTGIARLRYQADDGLSFDYRRGGRSCLEMTAWRQGRRLHLTVNTQSEGFGRVSLVPFSVNRFAAFHLETDGRRQVLQRVKRRARLAGEPFDWYRWEPAPE